MLQPIPDHHLGLVAVANEIARFIQDERKVCGCSYTDRVIINLCPNPDMMSAISLMKKEIEEETQSTIKYDWSLLEDRKFTLDVDKRLNILTKDMARRCVNYGMRLSNEY